MKLTILLVLLASVAAGSAASAKSSPELRSAASLTAAAIKAAESGKIREAVTLFAAAVKAEPSAQSHTNLGVTYMRLNKLEDAQASYGRALAMEPGYPNTLSNLQALRDNAKKRGLTLPPLSVPGGKYGKPGSGGSGGGGGPPPPASPTLEQPQRLPYAYGKR